MQKLEHLSPKIRDFIESHHENIQQTLESLESDRRRLHSRARKATYLTWCIIAAFAIFILGMGYVGPALLCGLIGIVFSVIIHSDSDDFAYHVHSSLIRHCVNEMGWSYIPNYDPSFRGPGFVQLNLGKYFSQTHKKWGLFRVRSPHRHVIEGVHHGLKFIAGESDSEIFTWKALTSEQEDEKFLNYVINVDLPIRFLGTTIILQDRMDEKTGPGNLKRVNIVSSEFERIYDVYSDDQTEARFILDPEVIRRLTILDAVVKHRNLRLIFDNNKAILLMRNPGELDNAPASIPLNEPKYVARIMSELDVILTAIDTIVWSAAHQSDYKSNVPTTGT